MKSWGSAINVILVRLIAEIKKTSKINQCPAETDLFCFENSVDPDQMASNEAI